MPRPTRALFALTLAITVTSTLLVHGPVAASQSRASAGADLLVAAGAGGDCSASDPCGSINAAFARASSGDVIEMAAGRYGKQMVEHRPASSSFTEDVVVRPAVGAVVEVAGMEVFAEHLTVTGLHSNGSVFIRPGAHHSGFENVTTNGGTMLVTAADHVVLRDNRIVPGVDSDGMQIKGLKGVNPRHLLIEGNVIGPAQRGPARGHVDCIQFLGGEDVTVRDNVTFHCGTQSLIAGAGAGGTLPGPMLVENNVFHLCTVRTPSCDGYNTVNVNLPDLIFRHNTVVDGGAVFNDTRGLDVQRNYFDSLKTCAPEIRNNMYASSGCSADGTNVEGDASFVSPDSEPPDLRMAPGSAGVGFGADIDPDAEPEPGSDPVPGPAPDPDPAQDPAPGPDPNPGPGEDDAVLPPVQPIDLFCADVPVLDRFIGDVATVFRSAIRCLAHSGITQGTSPDTFSPNEKVTRAQMASFIAREIDTAVRLHNGTGLNELPSHDGIARFRDVRRGDVHKASIDRLAAVGIIEGGIGGASHSEFGPHVLVTRGQMASFINRAQQFLTGSPLSTASDFFDDDDGGVHERNINAIASRGIAVGDGISSFSPSHHVSRGQMAAFIVRHLSVLGSDGRIIALPTIALPALPLL